MIETHDTIFTLPTDAPVRTFTDANQALEYLTQLYDSAADFLCEKFTEVLANGDSDARYRAFYPEVRITTTSYASIDSRLSFGHVAGPGTYAATVTRPRLFADYLTQQIGLLLENHNVPVQVGYSTTPIPVHFAVANDSNLVVPPDAAGFTLRDVFDVPDLSTTNDDIVNGRAEANLDGCMALAPFTAQRIDYSLARLSHYTATDPEHFQTHILFTNYQFYVEEFEAFARAMLDDPNSGYTSFVATGNVEITDSAGVISPSEKMPQMPTYHLKRADQGGITLVNI
ncbi:MAG: AMP nucleosidase, partial [Planktomarina sp.]